MDKRQNTVYSWVVFLIHSEKKEVKCIECYKWFSLGCEIMDDCCVLELYNEHAVFL